MSLFIRVRQLLVGFAIGITLPFVLATTYPAASGIQEYEVISAASSATSANKEVTANCSAGLSIIGGGAHIDDTDTNLALAFSRPTATNDGWEARGHETDNVSATWTLTAYALCAQT